MGSSALTPSQMIVQDQELLLIVGVTDVKGKKSGREFDLLFVCDPPSGPKTSGLEARTLFCDPGVRAGFQGPGVYRATWQIRNVFGNRQAVPVALDIVQALAL